MTVVGLEADPVHRRQVADRIGLVGVQHQLGLGGGARGEVQQQRVVDAGHAVRGEDVGLCRSLLEGLPARGRATHGDAPEIARQVLELVGVRLADHHMPDLAALDAVDEVFGGQQRGRGDHHRAELDRGEHGLPQRHFVAEHDQDALAALDALLAQPVGDAVRARRHLGEGQPGFAAVFLDDPQRRVVVALGHGIEVVQRPVELLEPGPLEAGVGGRVVAAVLQQEVARREKFIDCTHGFSPLQDVVGMLGAAACPPDPAILR